MPTAVSRHIALRDYPTMRNIKTSAGEQPRNLGMRFFLPVVTFAALALEFGDAFAPAAPRAPPSSRRLAAEGEDLHHAVPHEAEGPILNKFSR